MEIINVLLTTAARSGYGMEHGCSRIVCRMKLLTPGAFNNYSIDNISGGNGGLDMFDGYSTVEKYQSLSTPRQDGGTSLQREMILFKWCQPDLSTLLMEIQ